MNGKTAKKIRRVIAQHVPDQQERDLRITSDGIVFNHPRSQRAQYQYMKEMVTKGMVK